MRCSRMLSMLLVLASCSIASAAAPDAPPKPVPNRPALAKGVAAEYDVQYVPDGDPAQTLDLYYPDTRAEKPLPLLVWIHGGGWFAGSTVPWWLPKSIPATICPPAIVMV